MTKALLIPTFEPNDKVVPFLSTFKKGDFDYFLVVNDGSNKEKFGDAFKEIAEKTVFEVIGYDVNQGKGYALKFGIKYLIDKYNIDFIVTADCDGQHTYEDILNINHSADIYQDTLLLGSRNFYQDGIPRTSRVGNKFSMKYFKMATGKKLKDTQTGLRGIPSDLFHLALTTKGERYEYEMNFLTDVVRHYPYREIDIQTIYEDGKNETTHFRTFQDSVRIYKTPLLYIIVSLASFGIDTLIFHLLQTYVFNWNEVIQVYVPFVIARVISGIFNFLMFHFVVFQSRDEIGKKAVKYWILWLINLGIGSSLTYITHAKLLEGAALTLVKFVIDVILAILNFIINLSFIFVRKKIKK